jgi:tRNA (cmo5U34)-methyltransferase
MWDEQDSRNFIDFGRYFVPDRETQIQIICDLIPPSTEPFHVLELCCGEGLLAREILKRFDNCTLLGLDGSSYMLSSAGERLAPFSSRAKLKYFDLSDTNWRNPPIRMQAVVSSLCIHHLDDSQKQALFRDMHQILLPGGAFLIADIIQPVNKTGIALAANGFDEVVRKRSFRLGGDDHAYIQFQRDKWNLYRYPDPGDKPSSLFDQMKWLEESGFGDIDVFWMEAGHVILGAWKKT